jgi:hypothetical protein
MGFTLTNKGGQNTVMVTGDAGGTIQIEVTETAGRCPEDYTTASSISGSLNHWTANGHVYTKIMD